MKTSESDNLRDRSFRDLQTILLELEPLKVMTRKNEKVFRTLADSTLSITNLGRWLIVFEQAYLENLTQIERILLDNVITSDSSPEESERKSKAIRKALFDDGQYDEMSAENLAVLVESKREELNKERGKFEILCNALDQLKYRIGEEIRLRRLSAEKRDGMSLDEDITMSALVYTNKALAEEDVIREYLKELGIKEDTIETVWHPGVPIPTWTVRSLRKGIRT